MEAKCKWHQDGTLPEEEDAIFVFGSNMLGQHVGGAARVAEEQYGAAPGFAMGAMGHSYAVATLNEWWNQVSLETVRQQVLLMLEWYEQAGSDFPLFITRVGCGIAGFSDKEIAPMFESFLDYENVSLPDTWKDILL